MVRVSKKPRVPRPKPLKSLYEIPPVRKNVPGEEPSLMVKTIAVFSRTERDTPLAELSYSFDVEESWINEWVDIASKRALEIGEPAWVALNKLDSPEPEPPKLNERDKRLLVRTASKDKKHRAMTYKAIGAECGLTHVSSHAIAKVLKEHGLPRSGKK